MRAWIPVRPAEQSARKLIADHTKLVSDLAVADTERTTTLKEIEEAREHGRQLVRDAEARAAQLLQAAREHTDDLERRYSDQHTAALTGGWNAGDLEQLGFTAPTPARRTRATTRSSVETTATLDPGSDPARPATSKPTTSQPPRLANRSLNP